MALVVVERLQARRLWPRPSPRSCLKPVVRRLSTMVTLIRYVACPA